MSDWIFTLIMLGIVRYCRQVPWPPPNAETPRFSITRCKIFVEKMPRPAVKESPIAAITSISPGRNLFTFVGGFDDFPPAKFTPTNYYK